MQTASDLVWLHGATLVNEAELAQMCGMSVNELQELVDYGALVPVGGEPLPQRLFSAGCVPTLRQAARLRADFDLDLFAAGLLLGYLQRIEDLEQQVRALHAHLPQHRAPQDPPPPPKLR